MTKRFTARLACAGLALVFALTVVPAAFAAPTPQDVTITFSLPVTGGAPTGYRLFKDGVLVGSTAPSQVFTALLPDTSGSYQIGVEAFNATGTGQRVTKTVTPTQITQVPGPVQNLTITLSCATTSPPTCTVTVN